MYPSQTSLIPATVAVVRFIEQNGFGAFLRDYPHWYLGTTPTKYLVGPVVPLIMVGVHRLIPTASLFTIVIGLMLLSFVAGALGWGILTYKLTEQRLLAVIVGVLLLILPWRVFNALSMAEASAVIAQNLLPFVFLGYWSAVVKSRISTYLRTLGLTVLILLINTRVVPLLVVGVVGVTLASTAQAKKSKLVLKLLLAGVAIATSWYGFNYWITILFNPSIGGLSGMRVILRLFELGRGLLPLFMAVLVVYFSGRIKTSLSIFTTLWLSTFVFLTGFRFLSDPDFWQDWTTWIGEIEIGLGIYLASALVKKLEFVRLQSSMRNFQFFLLFLPFIFTWYIYTLLGRPPLLTQSLPEGVKSLSVLDAIVEQDEIVFLSGATVFWANALYDLRQVRGGADHVAIHPFWHHAAYAIRENGSVEVTRDWLDKLSVAYVLVHTSSSAEYYHDFKQLAKWEELGQRVWEEKGDVILKTKKL